MKILKKILGLAKLFFAAESGKEIANKGSLAMAGFGALYVIEYSLMGVAISLTAYLHYIGLGYLTIVFIAWPFNIAFHWLIVRANDKSEKDFTFSEGQGRVAFALGDKIRKLHIIWRIVLSPFIMLVGLIWLGLQIIWNGAGPIVIFLKTRDYFNRRWLVWSILIIISGIQMAIWIKVYILGLDSVFDLIKK